MSAPSTLSAHAGLSAHAQPRRSSVRALMYAMHGFGVFVGLVMPFAASLVLGSDSTTSPVMITLSTLTGLMIGSANYILFRVVIARHTRRMVTKLDEVIERVDTADDSHSEFLEEGAPFEVRTSDDLGRIAQGFNALYEAIVNRLRTEWDRQDALSVLGGTTNLDELSRRLLSTLERVSEAGASAIYVERHSELSRHSVRGFDADEGLPDKLGPQVGLAWRAVKEQRTVVAPIDAEAACGWSMSTPLGPSRPRSVAMLPLLADGRVIGLVNLGLDEATLPKKELIDGICAYAGPVLQNAILHSRLEKQAAVDELTQLLNRRFGTRRLGEEFSRSLRHGVPLSTILLDVDHFKSFNDTYGHDMGDEVLRVVAAELNRNVRSSEVACRYGGEEFLIVAPGTGLEDACVVAERLRRRIETTEVRMGRQVVSVTASFGVASWPVTHISTPDALVSASDEALYHAKEAGRNRVSFHHPAGIDVYRGAEDHATLEEISSRASS